MRNSVDHSNRHREQDAVDKRVDGDNLSSSTDNTCHDSGTISVINDLSRVLPQHYPEQTHIELKRRCHNLYAPITKLGGKLIGLMTYAGNGSEVSVPIISTKDGDYTSLLQLSAEYGVKIYQQSSLFKDEQASQQVGAQVSKILTGGLLKGPLSAMKLMAIVPNLMSLRTKLQVTYKLYPKSFKSYDPDVSGMSEDALISCPPIVIHVNNFDANALLGNADMMESLGGLLNTSNPGGGTKNEVQI